MIIRTDHSTAMRVEFAIFLLAVVGHQEAALMLARHQVPVKLAVRVLTQPASGDRSGSVPGL